MLSRVISHSVVPTAVRSFTAALSKLSNISSAECMAIEDKYGAHNYHPMPVVLTKGQGCYVWDCEGNKYYDFLSGYSAVSQGHCHPRLVKVMQEQAARLTLTARAFHNDMFAPYTKFLAEFTGYDKILPMNTGAEAVETAVKLCRRWAYDVKGVPKYNAKVIFCQENFHGRTLIPISASDDPESYDGFGPFSPGIERVPYNDIPALEKKISEIGDSFAGFVVEPIQGEAGIVVPDDGYLAKVKEVCHRNKGLFICDEIQAGLARTGKMFCWEHDGARPDIVILGKALSGGMLPISAVACNDEIMLTIKPGQHGSTFGGSPLASRIAMEALSILKDEKLAENSAKMGEILKKGLLSIGHPAIKTVRGRGLFLALVIDNKPGKEGMDICMKLMKKGVLAKPTHGDKIRFAPPLIINESQVNEVVDICKQVFKEL